MKLIDINNYWLSRFWRLEIDYPTCFICGKASRLERCHLIPRSLGGSNELDNLVLLCNEHHRQAPNLALDKEVMLKWIEVEAETYDHFFNMKKDDLSEWIKYCSDIWLKLKETLEEDFDWEDVTDFLMETYKEKALIVDSHHQANTRTRILFFKYMSEYKNLEIDCLKYLYKNKNIRGIANDKKG